MRLALINGHRRKLTKVLSDPAITVLVVEDRDRLTGFGFGHRFVTDGIESALSARSATHLKYRIVT